MNHLLVCVLLGVYLGIVQGEVQREKRDIVSETPIKLLSHFIVSGLSLQKAIERLDVALETEYAGWELDTIDTDEVLADVEDMVRCESGQCALEMDIAFTVQTSLSEAQGSQVCQSILDFFAAHTQVNGAWDCVTALSSKRDVGYTSSVVYTETEDNGFDSDAETDFAFACWKMQQASNDIDDSIEETFGDWELNTHAADHMLDYFDRNYWCDGGYCSIDFILSFSVTDSAALDSEADQESVCGAIESFFETEADVSGNWKCSVSPRPTKDDPTRFYATVTYSEGSQGLTSGEKAGIVIGCLLILLLLVIIIAVLVVQSQSKNRADYV